MRSLHVDPFQDTLAFLPADTGDVIAPGVWRFGGSPSHALLAASLFVAGLSLADDSERRRGSAPW